MGQVNQSPAQQRHRKEYSKWMGQDTRHAMDKKRIEWSKEHAEYLGRLIFDMYEPGARYGQ